MWNGKFREQGMLNDHPKRCFYKITLKNWKVLHSICLLEPHSSPVLRHLSQVRSGQLLQELKSAQWFQLSRQLWAKKDEGRSKTDASPSAVSCWEKVPMGHPEGQTLPRVQEAKHRDGFHNNLLLLAAKACSEPVLRHFHNWRCIFFLFFLVFLFLGP